MTIYEMLFREDIYGIIEKTLEEYYKDVHGKTISVKVERNKLQNSFVIYPRLGVVVARIPSFEVMKDIYAQFNVQGNWLRKLVAWGYITLVFATFGLMAPKSLRVSDNTVLGRSTYIMPCNRKIRIFDYSKGYVDAILKVGFNDACFKNELKYRVNPKFDFIPPIIASGNRWYREVIIKGFVLVRIPQPKYNEILGRVCEYMENLYGEVSESIGISDYCNSISEYIESKLFFLRQEKKIEAIDYISNVLKKALSFIVGVDMKVPVVLTHGDLQTGNILIDKKTGEVTIYDWETAGIRSVWYDTGKLFLYSQRKGKYAYMIENRNEPTVKDRILYFDKKKEYPMTAVMSVMVLEELQAFVDEICDLPGAMGTEIMDRLTDELKQTSLFA